MLGEWSLTIASIVPSTMPLPEQIPVGGLSDRRAAFELGGSVGDLLGGDRQVVRTRLDGQGDALGLGRTDRGKRMRVTEMQDVGAASGPASGVDDGVDRRSLALGGSRGEECLVSAPEGAVLVEQRGILGVDDET